MPYKDVAPPSGEKITRTDTLNVPDQPIIPFIRGDGTGPDIWAASERVFDAAVEKAYGGRKKISWFEVFAGEETKDKFGELAAGRHGGSFPRISRRNQRSADHAGRWWHPFVKCALRQMLDLYVCLRPVRYFKGVPSPVKHPEKVNMVIFRENTEDIYAGIEFAAGTPEAKRCSIFSRKNFPKQFEKIRFGTKGKAAEFWKKVGAPEKDRCLRRHRDQAGQPIRHRPIDAQRDRLCNREQAQERDAGAQGQHHEVHRRRLPRLGL